MRVKLSENHEDLVQNVYYDVEILEDEGDVVCFELNKNIYNVSKWILMVNRQDAEQKAVEEEIKAVEKAFAKIALNN